MNYTRARPVTSRRRSAGFVRSLAVSCRSVGCCTAMLYDPPSSTINKVLDAVSRRSFSQIKAKGRALLYCLDQRRAKLLISPNGRLKTFVKVGNVWNRWAFLVGHVATNDQVQEVDAATMPIPTHVQELAQPRISEQLESRGDLAVRQLGILPSYCLRRPAQLLFKLMAVELSPVVVPSFSKVKRSKKGVDRAISQPAQVFGAFVSLYGVSRRVDLPPDATLSAQVRQNAHEQRRGHREDRRPMNMHPRMVGPNITRLR